MASAEWCAWLEAMPGRTHADRLWPLVLKIPGLMQQVDILAVNQSNVSESLVLLEQIDAVDRSLDAWLAEYDQDMPDSQSLYWSSTAPPKAHESSFMPPIEFKAISLAQMMMSYWAYKLELSILREEIETTQVTTTDCHSIVKGSRTRSHHFALLIGRSLAYWLKHVSADVCLYKLLYAVRLGWAWFARYPKVYELELCAWRIFRMKMMSAPKTRMAEFVMDMFCKPPPQETS